MSEEKSVYKYEGEEVDVFWDGKLCIHIGECGRAQGDLFVAGRQPWCQPDTSATTEVVDVVKRCPTGSLTYLRKDGTGGEVADDRNVVVVSNSGPLYFRGDLRVAGEAAAEKPGVRFRAAFCRCGESGNKPFCDNSHEGAGFRDYGAVGETGEALAEEGGALEITSVPNGPLIVSGHFSIVAASGRVAWQGTRAALCRCGASGNKPMCDGSHKAAGFEAS